MSPSDALRFVRVDQGEPKGFRWQLASDGGKEASWGVVIPDDLMEPYQYLPETTAWNGRGNGEEPDGEYSVRLVKLPEQVAKLYIRVDGEDLRLTFPLCGLFQDDLASCFNALWEPTPGGMSKGVWIVPIDDEDELLEMAGRHGYEVEIS